MNNIYVDELPKSCGECQFCDKENSFCEVLGQCFRDGYDYTDCPLKSINDIELKYYNGQILHSEFASLENKIREDERKKVVQEAKQKLCRIEDTLINLGNGKEDALSYFVDILDQIERGE